MISALRIGVDLGGTKIAAIAMDGADTVIAERRVSTPRDDYAATIEAIADLVGDLESEGGSEATVGIGMPGSISPATGVVQNANSVWLNGRPFDADLTARLKRPVRLANDANCFALSEACDGSGEGASCVFGVILGTGCGGGIVIDGKAVTGPRAIGGEWGHTPLPWPTAEEHPGPRCWCGRHGCLETWISGPGLAADHARLTGQEITAEDIASRAGGGDEAARATLQRHADRLARGLAVVVDIVDPDVIVLGGGLSNLKQLYEEVAPQVATHVFADETDVLIVPPAHGAASGVRGAARLWDGSEVAANRERT